ncbi:hypothetical protein B4119_0332 [Parageobacillus caldoxylosilyticus]|uniref:Uncharacterized protein n=1 Tax=Saccharococcus caldoxylosilyticus TaxID=81408 RepID=A0A150LAB0_9BACL|nr:hypothetical protein B4119_0332 [Parageobacillus caldoxylosilyticus]
MRERKEYYYAKAKKLGLFSSGEEQSISSRQPLDGAERTSSSFLHGCLVFSFWSF